MTYPPRRAPLLAAAVCAAAVCAAALGWAEVHAADRAAGQGTVAFVGGIEDLPLMPGLEEDAAGRMVFDTAAGRIVEAFASGAVSRTQVLDFYAATLPQLGWRREGETAFLREDEILVLEFSAGKAGPAPALTVRFALSPAKAGGNSTGTSRRPKKP